MFRMYGRKVEILKYQVSYTENEEQVCYAASEQEANEIAGRVNGTVSALPAGDDAWMDGMEVSDVPDTYAEALRICQMGQMAYQAAQDAPTELQLLGQTITDMQLDLIEQGQFATELQLQMMEANANV